MVSWKVEDPEKENVFRKLSGTVHGIYHLDEKRKLGEEEWEQQVREQFAADALLSGMVSLDFEHSLKDEAAAAAEAAAAPVKAEPEKKKKVSMRCRLCSF